MYTPSEMQIIHRIYTETSAMQIIYNVQRQQKLAQWNFYNPYICYAQSTKLPISWNRQEFCPFHEIGNWLAHFVK